MRRWIGMVMAVVLALAVWVPAVGAESQQGDIRNQFFMSATSPYTRAYQVGAQSFNLQRVVAWCDPVAVVTLQVTDSLGHSLWTEQRDAASGGDPGIFPFEPALTGLPAVTVYVTISCSPAAAVRLSVQADIH